GLRGGERRAQEQAEGVREGGSLGPHGRHLLRDLHPGRAGAQLRVLAQQLDRAAQDLVQLQRLRLLVPPPHEEPQQLHRVLQAQRLRGQRVAQRPGGGGGQHLADRRQRRGTVVQRVAHPREEPVVQPEPLLGGLAPPRPPAHRRPRGAVQRRSGRYSLQATTGSTLSSIPRGHHVLVILGFLLVFGSVIGGYLMHHGQVMVLMQVNEFIIIGGAGVGAMLIANPLVVVKRSVRETLALLKPNPYTGQAYAELLQVLYDVFQTA